MAKKIFVWVAHPKGGSLCSALANAYQFGCEAEGAEIRRMELSQMAFEKAFSGYGQGQDVLEPDLLKWQENVAWADHVMFIHPYWWGSMPAEAKMVLDRALTPGFAYKSHARGVAWARLLTGKTAAVVVTSDTPPIIDTLMYWRSGRRVLKNQVLGFCGIKTRNALQLGSVKLADQSKIQSWFSKMEKMGTKAARTVGRRDATLNTAPSQTHATA